MNIIMVRESLLRKIENYKRIKSFCAFHINGEFVKIPRLQKCKNIQPVI